MGFPGSPGARGRLLRAHGEFGGCHAGFQSILPVQNAPVGVGYRRLPTATPYVRTTSLPSMTYRQRSDKSTFKRMGALASAREDVDKAGATKRTEPSASKSCQRR